MSKNRNAARRIAHVSLLITLAVVVRNLSYSIYIGGVLASRINFSGIFTRLAAILFGPVYGGLASGIQDVIGYLLRPEGPFIPWLTLTAIAGGAVAGFLWKVSDRTDNSQAGRYYLLFFACMGLICGINRRVLFMRPESGWCGMLAGLGNNRELASLGLIVFAGIGIALYLLNMLFRRISAKWQVNVYFVRVLFTVGLSGLLVTTLNTFIIRSIFPELGQIGFLAFWIPRLIKEAFVVVAQSYVVALLLPIYNRYFRFEPVLGG